VDIWIFPFLRWFLVEHGVIVVQLAVVTDIEIIGRGRPFLSPDIARVPMSAITGRWSSSRATLAWVEPGCDVIRLPPSSAGG
jgi:hypothetical protein